MHVPVAILVPLCVLALVGLAAIAFVLLGRSISKEDKPLRDIS